MSSTANFNDAAEPTTASRIDKLARRRAKAKMGWFAHATAFTVVNLGLITLSLMTGGTWAIYPLLGWGVGLAMHGVSVWALPQGSALMDRMVEKERAKLSGSRRTDLW
ncbi:MAG: hypothetical protein JWQ73_4151 [Variovorax sp.]|nr:hypothetical protein [Variovorax sp.]